MGIKPLTEAGFQKTLIQYAEALRWLVFHVYDSRRSRGAGFPDLVMVRGGILIHAELKVKGRKPTAKQRLWLAELEAVSVNAGGEPVKTVQVYKWGPENWAEIQKVLQ